MAEARKHFPPLPVVVEEREAAADPHAANLSEQRSSRARHRFTSTAVMPNRSCIADDEKPIAFRVPTRMSTRIWGSWSSTMSRTSARRRFRAN